MKADVHPQQPERLKALYSYEILDTDREAEFDEVVALAAKICGTSVSVVNLIDAERQWFKAEVGLGVRETPLETSLCSHAILQDDFVEIPDTLADDRMKDNPLCTAEQGLRFYAGALLKTADGLPLGTLCVLHDSPMQLTPLQRETLRVLARQVKNQMELRRLLKTADVLGMEVHHRVKNSLQAIASLTRIQARAVKGEEARAALATVQQRISSVAALHELLYKTNVGDRINLHDFIANVVGSMRESAPATVRIETDVADVEVNSSQAAAIGIVVNEFAANSFKHAFPDGQAGWVQITVNQLAGDMAQLRCSDNGIGLSSAAQQADHGFGLKILEASAAQLGGGIVYGSEAIGTTITLEFPVLG